MRQATDVLIGPPRVGKTNLAQDIGYEAIKLDFQVLYRSICDLVRVGQTLEPRLPQSPRTGHAPLLRRNGPLPAIVAAERAGAICQKDR